MFKKITRSTLTALGILPLAFFSEGLRAEQSTEVFGSTRLVAQAVAGSKNVGGSLDLLVPFYGDNTQIWYGDIQAFGYGEKYHTVGIGGGHRQVVDNAIYGIYGFFDRQVSPNKVYYNCYNMGFERLGETWDFRTNIYLYANSNVHNLVDRGQKNAFVQGNNIKYTHLYDVEKVYNGADVEVGRTLGFDNLRGYLGYYNFGNVIKGPKARVEYQINSRVALSASTQTDVRGWLTYAGVSYWFGKTTVAAATGIESRLTAPVVRDMTVAANVIDSYVEYDVDARNIYFAKTSAHMGATAVPADATVYSLDQAIALSKDNDIIYLVGNDIPFDISKGLILKPGQTLWASTHDLYANGLLLQTGDSARPVSLVNGGITVTDGATLSGFTLDGSDIDSTQSGITIDGTSAVSISDVNVTGFNYDGGSAGLIIVGDAPVTLTNITSDYNGVGLLATAGTIAVHGKNSFQNNFYGPGIYLDDTAQLTTLTNANTSGNATDGISIRGSSSYSANFSSIISNKNGGNGLIIAAPVNLTATDLTVNSNRNGGVNVYDGVTKIYGVNTFSGNTGAGVYVQNTGKLTYLENATIVDNIGNGIAMVGDATFTTTLMNVRSNDNDESGLMLDNANATVTFTNLVSNSNIKNGLWVQKGVAQDSGVSTANEFKSNFGYGVLIGQASTSITTTSGTLVSLTNADTSGNAQDGILLNSNATTDNVNLSNITSQNNGNDGFNFLNAHSVITASNLHGDSNAVAGLALGGGTLSITGTNTFSSNIAGDGIQVANSGYLKHLENITANSNGTNGLTIAGDASGATTLNGITTNSNGKNGISIANTNADVTFNNLKTNDNKGTDAAGGNGLWIQAGTVQDGGSTANSFTGNAQYGVLVGQSATTSSAGRLLSLTNADTSSNNLTGLVLNSSNTTDPATLTNITSNGSTTGRGIWILQAGTVNINTATTNSNTTRAGILVNNHNVTVNMQNITAGAPGAGNNIGLSILAGNVIVAGSENSFSYNAGDGITVSGNNSALNLSNASITANAVDGLRLQNPGKITVTSTSISGSNNYGVEANGASDVELNATSVNSNAGIESAAIYANNSTIAVGSGSSIISTSTGGYYAIAVTNNSTVTIANDNTFTLHGIIANIDSVNTSSIFVAGTTYNIGGNAYSCDYTAGEAGGSCTLVR